MPPTRRRAQDCSDRDTRVLLDCGTNSSSHTFATRSCSLLVSVASMHSGVPAPQVDDRLPGPNDPFMRFFWLALAGIRCVNHTRLPNIAGSTGRPSLAFIGGTHIFLVSS
jgi:hypothetical protein